MKLAALLGGELRRLGAVLCALALLVGCGDKGMVVDVDLISRYHAMAFPETPTVTARTIDAFLDYSAGMGEGMRATADINDRLKNFLGGRNVTYFRVGAVVEPAPIDIASPAANFMDLKNYVDAGSRLKVALDRIVSHRDRVSLFVTDFERVEDITLKQSLPGSPAPHPIDASAWGQNNFKEWLTAGNQLDIFATQYAKPDYWFDKNRAKTYPNWIYTLVFTPRGILESDTAFTSSVVPFLEEQYRNQTAGVTKHFAYNPGAFTVAHNTAAIGGNANENVVVQEFAPSPSKRAFEYYDFKAEDLLAFNQDASQTDKRIISKVRVDSKVSFLKDVTFGMKVYDISGPLEQLFDATTQAPPEVTTDVETGKKDTVANKPIVATFSRGEPTDSMFDFVYNSETKEVGIKLKPDYSGNARTAVFQIDIVVAAATLVSSSDQEEVLSLSYGGGYKIPSLGSSVGLALRDVTASIKGKVLYTFYVKIAR